MRPLIIGLALLSLGASYADDQAIRAIVGEARGEPFVGQVAVGEAIRNRGTLKGVYGAYVDVPQITVHEWSQARSAWRVSKTSNLTNGAIGWGNESDWHKFTRYKWFKNTVETVRIGRHRFYRLKTKGEKDNGGMAHG